MLRFTWFTLVLVVASLAGLASAADHDIIRLKKGTKLEGHCSWIQKGGIHVKLLDGKEVTIDLRVIDMIVFAEVPPAAVPKLHTNATLRPLVFETFVNERNMPKPVNGLNGAYVAHGRDAIDKNSRPFEISSNTVIFLAMWPDGPYPQASISVQGIGGTIGYHHLDTSELDPNQPVFMCKTFYDTFPGKHFADVSANDCNWLLAVATCEQIPNEADMDAFAAQLLEFGAYPPTPLRK